jgi:hypothetical protein
MDEEVGGWANLDLLPVVNAILNKISVGERANSYKVHFILPKGCGYCMYLKISSSFDPPTNEDRPAPSCSVMPA